MFNYLLTNDKLISWRVVYSPEEYSFDTILRKTQGEGLVLMINDVNLNVANSGEIVSLWGVCPHPSWVVKVLTLPKFANGIVKYAVANGLIPGISKRINTDQRWITYVDPSSGWVCIDSKENATIAIQIAENVILELNGNCNIAKLWLKPEVLPDI